jgi:hypothetical protein
MLSKWRFFVKRLGLGELNFKAVLDGIGSFLSPVWNALSDEVSFSAVWDPVSGKWSPNVSKI